MTATDAKAAQPDAVPGGEAPLPEVLAFWIRTPCGRAKYARLAARRGPVAQLRLAWFVLLAALRDLGQPLPEGQGDR